MHDAQVGMLFDGLIPPVPACTVRGAMRKPVQALEGLEVENGHRLSRHVAD